MDRFADPIDRALLNDWQRDFPVATRPYGVLAQSLGTTEADVIARLRAKRAAGQITRVGATVTPNTLSASTLAAVAAPEARIDEVAAIIGAEPGVNHSYLRENRWNLWFVATGPDRAHIDRALARIAARSRLRVLDLPLVRPFNLDLGFCLRGARARVPQVAAPRLAFEAQPYERLAARLGQSEAEVMARIRALSAAGIIARFGVIVRHRALGWRANAMVVWDLPSEAITEAGPLLAASPGVTLCYERRTVEGIWPYRLYSMIHSQSRAQALAHLEIAADLPVLRDVPHLALFSSRCFKQTGAMVADERSDA
jgi:DNA-binding Lrp family transcriptional regulator